MNRLTPGFTIKGRYRLIDRIAAGGMGEVWRASDELLEREVAFKVMHPHTADELTFAERFRDEAQYAAKLGSPHIVPVYDYGEDDGLAYLVMELAEGKTVAQLVAASGALDPAFVTSIVIQVADALAVAHAWGIVHRDVKPSNIVVSDDGHAKLMDFGIARAIEGISRTRSGEMLGTPQYLSPDQARGDPPTPASDLYSLGVVAHEMLTGKKPFDRSTAVSTALAHLTDPPPPLPDTVGAPLSDIVMQCLSKRAHDRPASARAVADALRSTPAPPVPAAASAGTPPSALTPTTVTVASRPPARPNTLLAVVAAAIVAILCLIAIFL